MEIRGRSLGVQLVILVAMVAVPLAGLIAYELYDSARRDKEHAFQLVAQMAETTADRASRYVENVRNALESIAKRPLVRAMDPDNCDPQLADFREIYGHPTNIIVVNLEGRIICGATPPPRDRVARITDEQLLRAVIADPRFRLSKPLVGTITKRLTVTAVQPVFAPTGNLAGTVAMGIDLANWVSFSRIQNEPKGTVHALITADGTVIARSAEPEAWIGRNVSAGEIHRHMLEMKQGAVRALGTDGADRVWGFTPVTGTEWYALSSVSANRVFGPMQQRMLESAVLLVMVLCAASAAVFFSIARLVRPMRAIGAALGARADGRRDVRVPVAGPSELVELAEAMNKSIESRDSAERALQRAQDMARLSHVVTGPDGSFESWSDTLPTMIGIAPAQMPTSTREWLDKLHPDDRPIFRDKAIEAGRAGTRTGVEYRLRRADGEWIHVRQVMEPIQGQADAPAKVRWFNTLQDVTEPMKRGEELRRFRAAMDISGDAILLIDRASLRYVDVNQTFCELVGYTRQELIGMTPMDLFSADRKTLERDYDAIIADKNSSANKVEGQYRHKNGSVIPIETRRRALHTESGWIIVGTARDISERKVAETKINGLNRVYAVLSGINAAIVRIRDQDELFREACRIAVEAGGFRMAWLGIVDRDAGRVEPVAWQGVDEAYIRQMPLELVESAGRKFSLAGQAVRDREPAVSDDMAIDPRVLLNTEAGQRGFHSLAMLPLFVSGEVVGVLALYAAETAFFNREEMKLLLELAGDISFALEHIEKSEKVDYLAYYDSLTGLANRTLFVERLNQFGHSAGIAGEKVGLVLLDVERIRTVNESLGRQSGDALLQQLAGRLELVTGAGDLARVGADVFAVVLQAVKGKSEVTRKIERIWQDCFSESFRLGESEVRISAKAGATLYPGDGIDAETLIKNAEAALRKAKKTGERCVFYAVEMTAKTGEKLTLENSLRQALEKKEFVLHYQPKVDLETRHIVGVEALIRWQSPELGLVPPMKFIPLMEETGLILEAGAWALSQAVADHSRWLGQGIAAPRVAVNVSAIQLRRRDFVFIVENALTQGATPPGIDLEITESLIMEDIQGSIEKLKAIRDLGVSIAIDDFGTGYSSLGYLARLPVQTLKIDRSFIITMLKDPGAMTLVQTIISLAHALNLKVVAEGVDDEAQSKILRLLRCDEMQGYLFSRPIPFDQVTALLTQEAKGRPERR